MSLTKTQQVSSMILTTLGVAGTAELAKADIILEDIFINGKNDIVIKVTGRDRKIVKGVSVGYKSRDHGYLTVAGDNKPELITDKKGQTADFYVVSYEPELDKLGLKVYFTSDQRHGYMYGNTEQLYYIGDKDGKFEIVPTEKGREIVQNNKRLGYFLMRADSQGEGTLLPLFSYLMDVSGKRKPKRVFTTIKGMYGDDYNKDDGLGIDPERIEEKKQETKRKQEEKRRKLEEETKRKQEEKRRKLEEEKKRKEQALREKLSRQHKYFSDFLEELHENIFDAYNAATTTKKGQKAEGTEGIELENIFQTRYKNQNQKIKESTLINQALDWLDTQNRDDLGYLARLEKALESKAISREHYNKLKSDFNQKSELSDLVDRFMDKYNKEKQSQKAKDLHVDDLQMKIGSQNPDSYDKALDLKFNMGLAAMNGLFQTVLEYDGVFGSEKETSKIYAALLLGKHMLFDNSFLKQMKYGVGMGLNLGEFTVPEKGNLSKYSMLNINPVLKFSLHTKYGIIRMQARPGLTKGINKPSSENSKMIGAHEMYQTSIDIFPAEAFGLTGKYKAENTEIKTGENSKGYFSERTATAGFKVKLAKDLYLEYNIDYVMDGNFKKQGVNQGVGVSFRH